MSAITKCNPEASRPGAMPTAALFRVMMILTVVLAFGLAHINLRVRLNQTRREISLLQSDQGRLLSEINAVRTANESLKNPKNLKTFAQAELGMVSYNPTRHESIAMPESIQTRYALARATESTAVFKPGVEAPSDRLLTTLGERIGLIAEAQAGEAKR